MVNDVLADGPTARSIIADTLFGQTPGSGRGDQIVEQTVGVARSLNPFRLYPNVKSNLEHLVGGALEGAGNIIDGIDKGHIDLKPSQARKDLLNNNPKAVDPGTTWVQTLARRSQLAGEELQAEGEEGLAELGEQSYADKVLGAGGASILAFPAMSLAMYQENVDAAMIGGATEEEARNAALPGMFVNTALEYLGLGVGWRAMKGIARIKDPFVRKGMFLANELVRSAGAEGATEALQQTVTNITEQYFATDGDLDNLPEILKGTLEAGSIGAGAGFLFPLAGGAVGRSTLNSLRADPDVSVEALTEVEKIQRAITEAMSPYILDEQVSGEGTLATGPGSAVTGVYGPPGLGADLGAQQAFGDSIERAADTARELGNKLGDRIAGGFEKGTQYAEVGAEGVGALKEGLLDFWVKPLIDRVANPIMHTLAPTPEARFKLQMIGNHIASRARLAISTTKSLVGEMQEDVVAYEQLISGGPLSRFGTVGSQLVRNELTELVHSSNGMAADSKFALAVENDDALMVLSPAAREVVMAYRALSLKAGKIAERMGVQIKMRGEVAIMPNGEAKVIHKPSDMMRELFEFTGETQVEEVPFVAEPQGRRLPRAFTDEFYYILKVGPSSQAFQRLARVLGERNGMKPEKALKQLQGMAEEVLSNAGTFEVARVFEYFPTTLSMPGAQREIPLLRSDPFGAARAILDHQMVRLGHIKAFGQDAAELDRLVGLFRTAGGREQDVNNLFKATQAIPLELPFASPAMSPGTPGWQVVRGIRALLSVLRSGRLTLAFVANSMETLQTVPAYTGWGDYAKTLVKWARHPMAEEMRKVTAHEAIRTQDVLDWGWERNRALESMSRRFGNVFKFMNKQMNEWNEMISAHAGLMFADRLRRGQGTEADLTRLRFKHQISQGAIDRLMAGEATDQEYADVARRVTEQTQGTTSQPAERSRAGNSPLWNFLIPFDQYAQKTTNRTLNLFGDFMDSAREVARIVDEDLEGVGRDRDSQFRYLKAQQAYKDLTHNAGALASWLGGAAAAGTLQLFLRSFVVYGVAGLKGEADDLTEDPGEFGWEAVKQVMFSGFIELLNRSIESDRPAIETMGQAIFPVSAFQDL
jgi:hypothetical protein